MFAWEPVRRTYKEHTLRREYNKQKPRHRYQETDKANQITTVLLTIKQQKPIGDITESQGRLAQRTNFKKTSGTFVTKKKLIDRKFDWLKKYLLPEKGIDNNLELKLENTMKVSRNVFRKRIIYHRTDYDSQAMDCLRSNNISNFSNPRIIVLEGDISLPVENYEQEEESQLTSVKSVLNTKKLAREKRSSQYSIRKLGKLLPGRSPTQTVDTFDLNPWGYGEMSEKQNARFGCF